MRLGNSLGITVSSANRGDTIALAVIAKTVDILNSNGSNISTTPLTVINSNGTTITFSKTIVNSNGSNITIS